MAQSHYLEQYVKKHQEKLKNFWGPFLDFFGNLFGKEHA